MISAIIQARMGSTRLPGKILKEIDDESMLGHVLDRVLRARCPDQVVVATTDKEEDDRIVEFCKRESVPYFRGSEEDVLDRFYQACGHYGSNSIVRLTADCPLIDPEVIDEVTRVYQKNDCDYASNTLERTYPDGLDVEVFSREALEVAWRGADLKSEREHVTPYIWKNDDRFDLCHVTLDMDLSELRWTVDEPEDLLFVRELYSRLPDAAYRLQETLNTLADAEGDWTEANDHIEINEGYKQSLEKDRKV